MSEVPGVIQKFDHERFEGIHAGVFTRKEILVFLRKMYRDRR